MYSINSRIAGKWEQRLEGAGALGRLAVQQLLQHTTLPCVSRRGGAAPLPRGDAAAPDGAERVGGARQGLPHRRRRGQQQEGRGAARRAAVARAAAVVTTTLDEPEYY